MLRKKQRILIRVIVISHTENHSRDWCDVSHNLIL